MKKGISPVVGVLILIGIVTLLATSVGAFALGFVGSGLDTGSDEVNPDTEEIPGFVGSESDTPDTNPSDYTEEISGRTPPFYLEFNYEKIPTERVKTMQADIDVDFDYNFENESNQYNEDIDLDIDNDLIGRNEDGNDIFEMDAEYEFENEYEFEDGSYTNETEKEYSNDWEVYDSDGNTINKNDNSNSNSDSNTGSKDTVDIEEKDVENVVSAIEKQIKKNVKSQFDNPENVNFNFNFS